MFSVLKSEQEFKKIRTAIMTGLVKILTKQYLYSDKIFDPPRTEW